MYVKSKRVGEKSVKPMKSIRYFNVKYSEFGPRSLIFSVQYHIFFMINVVTYDTAPMLSAARVDGLRMSATRTFARARIRRKNMKAEPEHPNLAPLKTTTTTTTQLLNY